MPTFQEKSDIYISRSVESESVFNLEFQPKSGIQLEIPIPMGINLGECTSRLAVYYSTPSNW